MTDEEKVREMLQDRVVSIVCEETGLCKNTIYAIKRGNTRIKPRKTTIKLLMNYLQGGINHG